MTAARTEATRFAPPDSTPIGRAQADEIARLSAQLATAVDAMTITIHAVWDENERLQDGVDRQMSIVASMRGTIGTMSRRMNGAESILDLIDPEMIGHKPSCGATHDRICTCGAVELRARITAFQAREKPDNG